MRDEERREFVSPLMTRQLALNQVPEFDQAMKEAGKLLFTGAVALMRAGLSADQTRDLILDILIVQERYLPTMIEMASVTVDHERMLDQVMDKAILIEKPTT